MTTVFVLRNPNLEVSSKAVSAFLQEREFKGATYSRYAQFDKAPGCCSCVTAIEYLFAKVANYTLLHAFIRDWPRMLLKRKWVIKEVREDALVAGDLVFAVKRERTDEFKDRFSITHVACAVDARRLFHLSRWHPQGTVQTVWQFFEEYEPVTKETLSSVSDTRNWCVTFQFAPSSWKAHAENSY